MTSHIHFIDSSTRAGETAVYASLCIRRRVQGRVMPSRTLDDDVGRTNAQAHKKQTHAHQ